MSVTGANPKRQYYPIDYGLPRPPTASTPLWEHLLNPNSRASTSRADMASVAPPLAPLDKNATSMRVLLHDTQSNFEKFGKHVGQLFEGIKECKLEIKGVNSRFERDREGLMGDIVDLASDTIKSWKLNNRYASVNRSQREIQKAVGNPVQCQQVETFFKDVERRLGALEHRLDAIQLFNQGHTQALQTQIQAVQLLLDKQASIIAAVLPLLPLLQAVPLHIDTVKSDLKDTLSTFFKDMPGPTPAVKTSTTHVSPVVNPSTKRKRPDEEEISSTTESTTLALKSPFHKKAREELEEVPRDFSKTTHVEPHSASNTSSKSPDRRGPSAALHSATAAQMSSRRNITATVGISPVPDLTAPMSSGSRRGGTFAVPKFVTPRRPLTDLPLVSPSSSIQRNASVLSRRPTHETSLGRSNTLASLLSMGNRTSMTPAAAARPPRILRAQAPFANASKPSGVNVESLENLRRGAASSSGGVSSSTLSGLPQSLSLIIKREIVELPESSNLVAPTLASAGLEILPAKPRSMLTRQKDRRSPVRVEGRRFIPLVDSEDEEESAM